MSAGISLNEAWPANPTAPDAGTRACTQTPRAPPRPAPLPSPNSETSAPRPQTQPSGDSCTPPQQPRSPRTAPAPQAALTPPTPRPCPAPDPPKWKQGDLTTLHRQQPHTRPLSHQSILVMQNSPGVFEHPRSQKHSLARRHPHQRRGKRRRVITHRVIGQ